MSKHLLLGWLVAPLIVLGFNGCAPPVYVAKSIRGRVVDAETQQPIEGAVVVADWILLTNVVGFGKHDQRMKISEAVTDANGVYLIPCWGPRLRPPFNAFDYLDPRLIVFKSRYEPVVMDNTLSDWRWMVRASRWDGETLKLAPFRGNSDDRLDQLDRILTGPRGKSASTPNFYREILKEEPLIGIAGKPFFRNVRELLEEGL
ncbi:MAG: carboxypeptidase regulatory-like domain-containing protein [Deltaproteobacteria bacterium]|nr:carboxypeptidase regulatory-like domain-containing protein [Deltaproteobacteria bacterium]MBI3386972.1 carboxypeptidase regulatory-like domain-containing protein [Deltaproteobacteria bacterium]